MVHVLIDFHIGLYGETSSQMYSLQAVNLSLTSLVYGWWIWSVTIAVSGDRSALVSALFLHTDEVHRYCPCGGSWSRVWSPRRSGVTGW